MSRSQADLHIFILGSYRSFGGSHRDPDRLLALEQHLAKLGYDAFLAIHRDSVGNVDLRKVAPPLKTQELVRFADLNLFVFTKTGVRNGLVAGLTETQTSQPDLTAILDESKIMGLIRRDGLSLCLSCGPRHWNASVRMWAVGVTDPCLVITRQVCPGLSVGETAES